MHLKKSWKEFRIWLGWVERNIFIPVGFVLLIVLAYALVELFRGKWRFVPWAIFGGLLVAYMLVDCIAINNQPRNWRLVVQDAKRFKRKYKYLGDRANAKLVDLMGTAKRQKNAEELYKYTYFPGRF